MHQAIFLSTIVWNEKSITERKWAKHKHRETKLSTKKPMDQWINQWGYKNYFKTDENSNKIFQNLWYTAKAVLRGEFIMIQTYLKKQEKLQIKKLNLHWKETEKRRTRKPKVSQRKEIIKIREEIKETETKKK